MTLAYSTHSVLDKATLSTSLEKLWGGKDTQGDCLCLLLLLSFRTGFRTHIIWKSKSIFFSYLNMFRFYVYFCETCFPFHLKPCLSHHPEGHWSLSLLPSHPRSTCCLSHSDRCVCVGGCESAARLQQTVWVACWHQALAKGKIYMYVCGGFHPIPSQTLAIWQASCPICPTHTYILLLFVF